MKWGIYDTFADENLCCYKNYIEWNITVFCVDECSAPVERFPQWSSAFGGLNFAQIVIS